MYVCMYNVSLVCGPTDTRSPLASNSLVQIEFGPVYLRRREVEFPRCLPCLFQVSRMGGMNNLCMSFVLILPKSGSPKTMPLVLFIFTFIQFGGSTAGIVGRGSKENSVYVCLLLLKGHSSLFPRNIQILYIL
jgi:hypothetical protein